MKKLNLLIVMALFAFTVQAQEVKFPALDTSLRIFLIILLMQPR